MTLPARTTYRHLLLAALLLLAAILPELPALHGAFQWDDEPHVSQNANLHDAAGLARTWTTPASNIQYYPLSITAFWLEYHCFGLNVVGYHAVNMLLHGINALLAWLLLRRLRVPWAWTAALLFAIHPMNVESVAYISELKNLLCALFYLVAAFAWLASADRRGWRAHLLYAACILAFLAAMLAKSTACTFPVVMLILAWWRRGRVAPRDWLRALPLIVIGLALGLFFAHLEHAHVGAHGADFSFTPLARLLIAGRAAWFYVAKFLWPSPLLVVYPRWHVDPAAWWQYLFPVAAVAVLIAAWWGRRKLGRGIFAGAALFLVIISPALGFVSFFPMIFTFVADHYAYLATIPLAVLFLAAVRRVSRRMTAFWWQMTVSGGLLIVLVPLTAIQATRWRTKTSLWEPAAAANPDSWYVTANLANAYADDGRFADARRLAERSLSLNDANSRAHFTLAVALLSLGNAPAAVAEYRRGLALETTNVVAWNNFTLALEQTGDFTEAQEAMRQSLALDPHQPKAWNNLALLLLRSGQWAQGAAADRRALAADPAYGLAHVNLGIALEKMGHFSEAAGELQSGLALIPENPRVRLELARSLAAANAVPEAIAEYQRVLAEAPNLAEARTEWEALSRRPATTAPAP